MLMISLHDFTSTTTCNFIYLFSVEAEGRCRLRGCQDDKVTANANLFLQCRTEGIQMLVQPEWLRALKGALQALHEWMRNGNKLECQEHTEGRRKLRAPFKEH